MIHFPHLPARVRDFRSSEVWKHKNTHTSLSVQLYSWDMFSCCAATALYNPPHPCFYLSFGSSPCFPTQFLACQFPSPSNAEWCSRGARNLEVQEDWGRAVRWVMWSIWEEKAKSPGESWIIWQQWNRTELKRVSGSSLTQRQKDGTKRERLSEWFTKIKSTESILKVLYFVRKA